MTNSVLYVLPRVPPAFCGIGDYSWMLAQELRRQHRLESRFLAAGISWKEPQGETEFPVERLGSLQSGALLDAILRSDAGTVYLHVSLYGYQKRAVPWWLMRAVLKLSTMKKRPRIVTMFHELFSSGSVRTSSFWLQPLQKIILRSLARCSDAIRTNREAYAAWLREAVRSTGQRVTRMPVFSTFGEPASLTPCSSRPPWMMMFGGGIHDGTDSSRTLARAAEIAQKNGIEVIHLFGTGKDAAPGDQTLGVKLQRHGRISSAEISDIMRQCRIGYNAYHPLYLGKSTIFNSFAAHGLTVITAGEGLPSTLPDGLRLGTELIAAESYASKPRLTLEELDAHSAALAAWYSEHNLRANAASLREDILATL